MATVTEAGSTGWGRIVWKAWPPKPSPQSARWGWFHRASSSANVRPWSVERQTAPGSVPAHTTPSSVPATSCQTRSTEVPLPSSKRGPPVGSSCQVAPRSSDQWTRGPIHGDDVPANRRVRPPRVSTRQE